MKVYLAGKITGDPNYREKFAAAVKKLEERAGVTVISPAVTPRAAYELGRSAYGFEVDKSFYEAAREKMLAPILMEKTTI